MYIVRLLVRGGSGHELLERLRRGLYPAVGQHGLTKMYLFNENYFPSKMLGFVFAICELKKDLKVLFYHQSCEMLK